MTNKDIIKLMNGIGEDLIEGSERAVNKRSLFIKLGALAACFCILATVTAGVTLPLLNSIPSETEDGDHQDFTDPAESTPAEESSPAIPLVSYKINYDLDGGIDGGNTAMYYGEEDTVIDKVPIRPGYDFVGWIGTGIDKAVKKVTVDKGSKGELYLKALWSENEHSRLSEFYEKSSTIKTGDMIRDILNGTASVKIDCSGGTSSHSAASAREVYNELKLIGADAYFVSETTGAEDIITDYTIVFGKTGVEGIDSVLDRFGENEYAVIVYSDKIIVWGGGDAAIEIARNVLNEMMEYVAKGGNMSEIGLFYSGTVN